METKETKAIHKQINAIRTHIKEAMDKHKIYEPVDDFFTDQHLSFHHRIDNMLAFFPSPKTKKAA